MDTFEKVFTGIPYDKFKKFDKEVQNVYMALMCAQNKSYYEYFEPFLETAKYLTNFIKTNPRNEYFILTSVGKHNPNHIIRQKLVWLNKHFPIIDLSTNFRYVHDSCDKALYAEEDCIIIDDYKVVLKAFSEAGGISIDGRCHKNIETNLNKHLLLS
ncbi:MAG: hypothetical protein QM489_01210 [Candidatus Izemoplasma sp.]